MANLKAKKVIKKGLSYMTIILIAVIGLMFLLTAYQSIQHPDKAPSIFGYQFYAVLSNSMNPHFGTGDVVIIDEINPSDVNFHDVIAFHENGKVITHRVTDIDKQDGKLSFETKGDNNNVVDDEAVAGSSLIGKQVSQIPKGGYAMHFISSPMGLFILIALPLTGYLLLELYTRIKKYRTNS